MQLATLHHCERWRDSDLEIPTVNCQTSMPRTSEGFEQSLELLIQDHYISYPALAVLDGPHRTATS